MTKLFIGLFLIFLTSNCYAEDYTLIKDKDRRTYKNWQIGNECPNGSYEQLAKLDEIKIGISENEFINILGAPHQEENNQDLKIYTYIVAVRDCWAKNQEARAKSTRYLPDYDIEWEPFFFKDGKFIGCGEKVQNEISKQYQKSWFSSHTRCGTERPDELKNLCGGSLP